MKRLTLAPLAAAGLVALAAAAGAADITPSIVAVRVSSEQTGNVGRNSIDGNLATRWSANGDGQWIDYDLGATRRIGTVTVAFYLGNTRVQRLDLQTGNGTTFTTRFAGSSSGTTTAPQSFAVNADARFLRLVGHGTTAGAWNSITEVRIFDGAAGPTPTPRPGATPTPTPTNAPPTGGGNFPARFNAPYVETWANNNLVNLSNATGNRFWTLAFMLGAGCNPMWNGNEALTASPYAGYIQPLRNIGGDVIVSFGGAAGTELGEVCTSVSSLQGAYQRVISQFGLTWIDLDIEGAAIANTANVDRRNQAVRGLQLANPNLRVSYTLGVIRTGLPAAQLNLLRNAQSRGVRVDVVNIMAMNYGPCYADMGQAAIDAAAATRNQLASIGMNARVGITPMLGANDIACEVFTTAHAQQVVNYANANQYVRLLAYWAQGRDPSRSYVSIFRNFR